MRNLLSFLTILSVILLVSCTATNSASSTDDIADNRQEAVEESSDLNIPLDQYLRKINGLRISGSGNNAKVEIMGLGNNTIMSGKNPLFVLDGRNVGTNLGSVSALVQTSDIKSVRVLKSASETAFYGSQGAAGVIVITTKK